MDKHTERGKSMMEILITLFRLISWSIFIWWLPGYLIRKTISYLITNKDILHETIKEKTILFLIDLGLGLNYLTLLGYLIDIIFFFCFSIIFLANLIVIISLSLFLLIKFKINISKICLKRFFSLPDIKRILSPLFPIGIFIFLVFVNWYANLFSPFIYPSDPLYWLFHSRFLLFNGELYYIFYEASRGFSLKYPLGIVYLLSMLAIVDPILSYDLVKLLPIIFGSLSLASVYFTIKLLTKKVYPALVSMIFVGSNYVWIWFSRLYVAHRIVEFLVPISWLFVAIIFDDSVTKLDSHKTRNQSQRGFVIFLSAILSTILIYHPILFVLTILPILVVQLLDVKEIKESIFVRLKFFILIISYIIIFTLPYFFSLIIYIYSIWKHRNLFVLGLLLTSKANIRWLFPTQDLLRYILIPFSSWNNLPLVYFMISLSIIVKARQKIDRKISIFVKINLFAVLLYYMYYISPIIGGYNSNLDKFLSIIHLSVYLPTRMTLHMTIPITNYIAIGIYILQKNLENQLTHLKSGNTLHLIRSIITSFHNNWYKVARVIMITLILTSGFLIQINWTIKKFESVTFSGGVRLDTIEFIRYIDENIPTNSVILADEGDSYILWKNISLITKTKQLGFSNPLTYDYLLWFLIRRENRINGIEYVGQIWYVQHAIYPRIIIGYESLFRLSINNVSLVISFLRNITDIDYLVFFFPNKYNLLVKELSHMYEIMYSSPTGSIIMFDLHYNKVKSNEEMF